MDRRSGAIHHVIFFFFFQKKKRNVFMLLYHGLLRVDELMGGPGFLIERKEKKRKRITIHYFLPKMYSISVKSMIGWLFLLLLLALAFMHIGVLWLLPVLYDGTV